MTQAQEVLRLLRERGSVTGMEALEEVGTMRLAARIMDLRSEGHAIRTETVVTAGGKRHARYVLDEPAQMEMRL